MAYVSALIELAKAVAWPAAIAWVAWYFRGPIIDQLPRVTKVGPVSLDPPTQVTVGSSVQSNDIIKQIEGYISSDLMTEARKLIDEKIPRDAKGQKFDEVSTLQTVAAALLVGGIFERLNAIIFGSQIALLQLVNAAPQTIDIAKCQYDHAEKHFPQTYVGYTFEQWIHFLEASILLNKNSDGVLQITPRGRGFLSYLIQNGYAMARPN